jgi:hypothetical protein
LQELLIFFLIAVAFIAGGVLLVDTKSFRLPSLPIALPSLPFSLPLRRSGEARDDYEDREAFDYEHDSEDEEAGSFAPSRSPFGNGRSSARRALDPKDDDAGFDYKSARMTDDEGAVYGEASEYEDEQQNGDLEAEDGTPVAADEEQGDTEAASETPADPNDLLSFFESATETSKVPEAIREALVEVSANELLAEARQLRELLRDGRKSA